MVLCRLIPPSPEEFLGLVLKWDEMVAFYWYICEPEFYCSFSFSVCSHKVEIEIVLIIIVCFSFDRIVLLERRSRSNFRSYFVREIASHTPMSRSSVLG